MKLSEDLKGKVEFFLNNEDMEKLYGEIKTTEKNEETSFEIFENFVNDLYNVGGKVFKSFVGDETVIFDISMNEKTPSLSTHHLLTLSVVKDGELTEIVPFTIYDFYVRFNKMFSNKPQLFPSSLSFIDMLAMTYINK